MNYWFTADWHIGHNNIIKACRRPFHYFMEMDEILVKRFNEKVSQEDIVYFLGDFSFSGRERFEEIFHQLHFKEFHFIRGNHDDRIKNFEGFTSISDIKYIKIFEQKIMLSHYALRSWRADNFGSWNLHGHSHGKLKVFENQLDVGVDTNDFYPYSFEEVKNKIEEQNLGKQKDLY